MSGVVILRREEPLKPMWWWGKRISSRAQKNREDSWIWDGERDGERKTDSELRWLTKWGENTGHWAKGEGGGLKILEGCQLYPLFCQQTMAAWDCQGWRVSEVQNTKRAQSIYETDTAKRELKTLERCQVFLLLFWVSLDGAGLKPGKKNHTSQIWNFSFSATPVYNTEGQK